MMYHSSFFRIINGQRNRVASKSSLSPTSVSPDTSVLHFFFADSLSPYLMAPQTLPRAQTLFLNSRPSHKPVISNQDSPCPSNLVCSKLTLSSAEFLRLNSLPPHTALTLSCLFCLYHVSESIPHHIVSDTSPTLTL